MSLSLQCRMASHGPAKLKIKKMLSSKRTLRHSAPEALPRSCLPRRLISYAPHASRSRQAALLRQSPRPWRARPSAARNRGGNDRRISRKSSPSPADKTGASLSRPSFRFSRNTAGQKTRLQPTCRMALLQQRSLKAR